MSNAARVFGTEAEDAAIIRYKERGKYRESAEETMTRTFLESMDERKDPDSFVKTKKALIAARNLTYKPQIPEQMPSVIYTNEIYFTLDTYYRNRQLPFENKFVFYFALRAGQQDINYIQVSRLLNQMVELEVFGPILFPRMPWYPYIDPFFYNEIYMEIQELIGQSINDSKSSTHFKFNIEYLPFDFYGATTYNKSLVKLIPAGSQTYNANNRINEARAKFTFTNPVNLDKMTVIFLSPTAPLRFTDPTGGGVNLTDIYNVQISYSSTTETVITCVNPTTLSYVNHDLYETDFVSFEDYAIPNLVDVNTVTADTYRAKSFRILNLTNKDIGKFTIDYAFPTAIRQNINRAADSSLGPYSSSVTLNLGIVGGIMYFSQSEHSQLNNNSSMTITSFQFNSAPAYALIDQMLTKNRTIMNIVVVGGIDSLILDNNAALAAQSANPYKATHATGYRVKEITATVTYNDILHTAKFTTTIAHGLRPGDTVTFTSYDSASSAVNALMLQTRTISSIDSTLEFYLDINATLWADHTGTTATYDKSTTELTMGVTYDIPTSRVYFTFTGYAPTLAVGATLAFTNNDSTDPVINAAMYQNRTVAGVVGSSYYLDNNAVLWSEQSMTAATLTMVNSVPFNMDYVTLPGTAYLTMDHAPDVTLPDFTIGDEILFSIFDMDMSKEQYLEAQLNPGTFGVQIGPGDDDTKFQIPALNAYLISASDDPYFPATCVANQFSSVSPQRMVTVTMYVASRRIRIPMRATTLSTTQTNHLLKLSS